MKLSYLCFNVFQNMSLESQMLQIHHPTVVRSYENIKDIGRREFERLNIILFSRKTTTVPVFSVCR